MRALTTLLAGTALFASAACGGETVADRFDGVVSVETSGGLGTGVVILPGFLVTDAHVVWPAEYVQVALDDGTRFRATVVGFDRHLDLAVLALPDEQASELEPLPIGSIEPGTTASHLGYVTRDDRGRDRVEVKGVLEEPQRIPAIDASFVGTNAAGIAGLSGGPLINARGEMVGITQFQVAADHTYALAAPDALAAVEHLIESWDAESPVELRLISPGATDLVISFEDPRGHAAYVVQGPEGGFPLELAGSSSGPLSVALVDSHGHLGQSTQVQDRGEFRLTEWVPGNEVRLVVLRVTNGSPTSVSLNANRQLRALADEDHFTTLKPGDVRRGVLDYPSDIDVYEVDLPAGGVSLIRLSSVTFDPFLQIELVETDESIPLTFDDNSGGGLFSRDAAVQFTARRDATYRLVVGDAGGGVGHAGGYTLSVSIPFVDQ